MKANIFVMYFDDIKSWMWWLMIYPLHGYQLSYKLESGKHYLHRMSAITAAKKAIERLNLKLWKII